MMRWRHRMLALVTLPFRGDRFASPAHRTPREKAAVLRPFSRRSRRGPINAKVQLNNLVSKTLRRPLLAGDVVYETQAIESGFRATVRVHGLEEDGAPLEFSGYAYLENAAELLAAKAAVTALPPPPDIEPRYPKPKDAAAWVAEELIDKLQVELDSTMADVLPTLAYLRADMQAAASFSMREEDTCRVSIRKSAAQRQWLPKEVRSVLVSSRTHGSKLAAALRARLMGEDGGESYRCLELKMAGKSATKEAAIATKILQRFLPKELEISFTARFEQAEAVPSRLIQKGIFEPMSVDVRDVAAGTATVSATPWCLSLDWAYKMAHAFQTGHRTHSCGELRKEHVGQSVTVCGWVQMSRDMNHFAFVDLRDRYGITQVVFPKEGADEAGLQRYEQARNLGREFVVKVTGKVVERIQKNAKRPTGDIEIVADQLEVVVRYRSLGTKCQLKAKRRGSSLGECPEGERGLPHRDAGYASGAGLQTGEAKILGGSGQTKGGLGGSSTVGLDRPRGDGHWNFFHWGVYGNDTWGEKDQEIKMNGVLDQGDDSEFTLDDTKDTMKAYERYVNLMGGPPTPEQEPTAEQLSAMRRRVETLQLSPYADFAVWVFAKKNLKALKLKTWTMPQDGSVVAKDPPGPPDHTAWLNSFRVYKTALLMLGIMSLYVLQAYEEFIEKVTKRYVGAWHLVASATGQTAPQSADEPTMECDHGPPPAGRALLARTTPPASADVDGEGHEGGAKVAHGSLYGGDPATGRRGHEGHHESQEGPKKEEAGRRQRGTEAAMRYKYKLKARWWQRRGKKPKEFWIEQWEWPVCWSLAGFAMPSQGDAGCPWLEEPLEGVKKKKSGRKRKPQGGEGGGDTIPSKRFDETPQDTEDTEKVEVVGEVPAKKFYNYPILTKSNRGTSRTRRTVSNRVRLYSTHARGRREERRDGGHKKQISEGGLRNLGVKIMAAWERFTGRYPEALDVAETYGSSASGTPLGIGRAIPTCGVYPAVPVDEQKDSNAGAEEPSSSWCYVQEGFAVKMSLEEAVRRYGAGAVSKLGLILKTKDDGTLKRRIIIDLRRSGGNSKSALPERLTLPRPVDAVRMATFQCEEEENLKAKYSNFSWDTEYWAREWVVIDVSDAFRHVAVAEEELARCMAPGVGHGRNGSTQRLKKECGQSSLDGRDPAENKVGRAGALRGPAHAPHGDRGGRGGAQRKRGRKDQRNKNGLFYVKRLNKVHLWLLDVIDAVAMQPFKYIRLRMEEATQVTITTDASPVGLGGMLSFNGVVVKYFEAPVTPTVINHFGTKYGEAASQGAMEALAALALLVALFHWRDSLASHVTVTLQSDSVVALAMAEKLTGKSPAFNRLGAEMAYRLEEMGLQSLRAVHIPGAANKVADYLSRPHEREGDLPKELTHAKGAKLSVPDLCQKGLTRFSLTQMGEFDMWPHLLNEMSHPPAAATFTMEPVGDFVLWRPLLMIATGYLAWSVFCLRGLCCCGRRLCRWAVEVMETKGERPSEAHNPNQAPLYKKVCSTYIGLIHDIDLSLVKETPHLWKTKCGWPYGFSNFTYVTNVDEPTSCKKCRALRKEVVVCTAANEMSDGKAKLEMRTRTLHENASSTPPFKIEDVTDANEDTRMRYRYLDIRRNPIKDAILLRNKVTRLVRDYLGDLEFCEVETPVLIKSTPEGARDFVVPSRMNPGQFYALPQSPQTFKQLLMVGGLDRYFQIVKCFRDEELRADRQPEFTQIDCEMSFVQQEDVLQIFEGMIRQVFKSLCGHEFPPFQRMEYSEAMDRFGIDKPDLRYDMELVDLTEVSKGKNFKMFDDAELVVGMCCKGIGSWSGKKVKDLEKKATGQEVGASALVWLKINPDGTYDCSAKKFFTDEDYVKWVEKLAGINLTADSMLERVRNPRKANAKPGGCGPGDLLLIIAGKKLQTQESVGKFRHLMGTELGLRSEGFRALWVVNFPMLEWDEDEGRFTAKHHPFTSPWTEDIEKMVSLDHKDPKLAEVRANAYDMVINGVEVGGGSVRIHERPLQEKVFSVLGFSKEEALAQFGFLMGAFEYGAPPHAGLAFGLDRLCTIIGGKATIRDFIAFPKNNMGRDTMINTPAAITSAQLAELSITTTVDEDGKPKVWRSRGHEERQTLELNGLHDMFVSGSNRSRNICTCLDIAAATMSIPVGRPRESLVKYDPPLELGPAPSDAVGRKGNKPPKPNSLKAQLARKTQLPPAESKPNTDDVLHALLPPREWIEDGKHYQQYVSNQPATRLDVIQLQEALDQRLMERQARETGICPVREELYSQCFDELIRQVTINCPERGLLLLRVRDEIRMSIAAYQTLYQSSVTFGTRKQLQSEQGKAETEQMIAEHEEQKKQREACTKRDARVVELKNKCEAIERREAERRAVDERKRKEEIDFLKHQQQHLESFLKSHDSKTFGLPSNDPSPARQMPGSRGVHERTSSGPPSANRSRAQMHSL
eukprot:s652_g19.t2